MTLVRIMFTIFFVFVLLPAQAANEYSRPAPATSAHTVHRPAWCKRYDERRFHADLRACHHDRQCQRQMRQKAKRCGVVH